MVSLTSSSFQLLVKNDIKQTQKIMQIYNAPKLLRYMTALGAYNSKTFTLCNQSIPTYGKITAQKKIHRRNKARLEILLKEISFQNLSK